MFKLELFRGIAPKFAPQLLPDNAAQTASGCKFDSGALRPYKGLSASVATVDINAKTIYLYNRSTPAWQAFTTDTDIIKSPIAKDAYGRTYYADGTAPKMKAVGSATLYDLGIPAPATAGISIAVDGTADPDPPEATDQETRYYVITYVSAYDEEGLPSTAMGPHTWSPGQHVDLTSLPTGPGTGTTNIASKRIYRTNTGSTSTEYQLVATISAATTSYADSVASSALGVVLPSALWDPPPATLSGLCLHPAGFAVGFSGSTLYCSETYLPHAWPYSYPVAGEIVAIGIYGNTILVTTKDFPYLFSGSAPDSLSSEKAEISMACISKRGMVDMGDMVIYPSAEGLVGIGLSQEPSILTESIIDQTSWATYGTTSLVAAQWDGKYVGFNGTTGFVFDPSNKDFITVALDGEAVFYDHATGKLYVKLDDETAIKTWDAGSAMTYTWKSKRFRIDQPRNFGAAQIYADTYASLTFKVYINGSGTATYTKTVTSSAPFRLPSGFLSDIWEFEIVSSDNINAAYVASTMKQLQVPG